MAAKKQRGITRNQKLFLQFFLEGDTKGNISHSAAKVGITRQAVYGWLRNDEKFRNHLQQQGEVYKALIEPHAWESLKRNVIEGDTASLALYFKLRGLAKDRQEVQVLLSPEEREAKERTLTEGLRAFVRSPIETVPCKGVEGRFNPQDEIVEERTPPPSLDEASAEVTKIESA